MSTLIQTCGQLRVGLQSVKIANQTRQDISALQQRLREWGRHADTRQALLEKVRIVDPYILVREDIAQADCSVQGLAQQAQKLLLAGGNVQELATDNLWVRLTTAASSANDAARSAARDQWRQFIESLGYVESPSVLDGRMLKTPANESLLETYRQHHAKYSAIVRADLPDSASTRAELISVMSMLRGLREQLKGTAPEAIRLFLKAVEGGGASLDMITPEVMEWLRENDDPNRFVVKSKANVSWR